MDEDGALIHDPVQECNDLINNRGCVKQYVNKGGNTNQKPEEKLRKQSHKPPSYASPKLQLTDSVVWIVKLIA